MKTMTRWDPFREMEEMLTRYDMPNLRSRLGMRRGAHEPMTVADWTPPVDVSETDTEFLIQVELPEMRREEVHVSARDGVLTITGERTFETDEDGKKYHRIERSYGTFTRTFTLPDTVQDEHIRAVFRDGVLYLHLPKTVGATMRATEIPIDG